MLSGGGEIAGESPEARRARCAEYLRRADEALGEGKLTAVRGYLQMANAIADASAKSKIETTQAQLVTAAEGQFAQAAKLADAGKHVEALEIYRVISIAVGASQVGRDARTQLARAARDPEVRQALNEVQAAALWALILQEVAQQAEIRPAAKGGAAEPAPAAATGADPLAAKPGSAGDDLRAKIGALPIDKLAAVVRTLDTIVGRYPKCPTGQRAAAIRKRLSADKSLARGLAEWNAAQLVEKEFKKGMTYERAKRYRRAAEIYNKIIAAYPDTDAAARATEKLDGLKGKYLPAARF